MSNATRPRPSTPPSESPFLEELTVFERGTGGYDTYRIPAMVVAPNGDLLAFAEGRVDGPDDHGNIDVVMKRSSDKGRTWSELSVVTDNGAHVAGNPGPVVDLMDPEHPEGRILMLFNTSSEPEDEIMAGRGVREVWVTESADNGATWSVPRNITLDVHRPLQSSVDTRYAFEEDWRWYAVTPGHAIQLVHGPARGRLFIPANHSTPEGLYASHAFWSDDHGISWHLGASVGEGTNEVQAVELANGDIMMNMRNHRGGRPLMRAVAISTDQGESWQKVVDVPELIEPRCQASIIRWSVLKTHGRDAILFANPAATDRSTMTVRLSLDEGRTWPHAKVVYSGHCAYSDLAVLPDGSVGLLYERDDYARIHFARFNREWVTGNE